MLAFDIAADGGDYCGYGSTHRYDLTDSAASVQVVSSHDGGAGRVSNFGVWFDPTNYVVMQHLGGSLDATLVDKGTYTTLQAVSYEATAHGWWRIGEKMGSLILETSADGVMWNTFAEQEAPFPLDNVEMFMNCGATLVPGSPATSAAFDNFNVQP